MPKKILYCASTVSHIMNFHLPYLKAFHEKGYEVWVIANEQRLVPYADHVVALPFCKKMTSIQNIRAVHMARRLIREEEFDIVSTHTMLASAVIRAAILPMHHRPKVFCTVHGYLFNESDGLKKWEYLLPEKICARVTDVLMVMNHEDFAIAERHKLYHGKLHYINGMGIDLTKFKPATREERISARKVIGISRDDFVYIYAAEFSKRKNQEFLIRMFTKAYKGNPRMKLLLAGNGNLFDDCKNLVYQLGADQQIRFLSYVKNMKQLYAACDVCVSTSLCEGLPFNVMEAMACGIPVIASDIKGHRDLICDGESGMLFDEAEKLLDRIKTIAKDRDLYDCIRKAGLLKVKKYDIRMTFPKIMDCYKEFVS